MANNNDLQAANRQLQEDLEGVNQELALQKIQIEQLIKRVEILEEKPPNSVAFGDHSSHSTASNKAFVRKESEKFDALTTYNFEAFNQYLDNFKEENPQYFEQDEIEFESEFFHTFLKNSPYQVLDLAFKRVNKKLTEFPQDSSVLEEKALLDKTLERFNQYPGCYESAWENFIYEVELEYKGAHNYSKGDYDE